MLKTSSENLIGCKSVHLDELPERCRRKYEKFLRTHDPDQFVPVAYRAKSPTRRLLWHVDFLTPDELPKAVESLRSCRLIYTGAFNEIS